MKKWKIIVVSLIFAYIFTNAVEITNVYATNTTTGELLGAASQVGLEIVQDSASTGSNTTVEDAPDCDYKGEVTGSSSVKVDEEVTVTEQTQQDLEFQESTGEDATQTLPSATPEPTPFIANIIVSTEQECIDEGAELVADGADGYRCEYDIEDNLEGLLELETTGKYITPSYIVTHYDEGHTMVDNATPQQAPGVIAELVKYCNEITVQYKFNPFIETKTETECKETSDGIKYDCVNKDVDIYGATETKTVTVYGNPKATSNAVVKDYGDVKVAESELYNEVLNRLLSGDLNRTIEAGLPAVTSSEVSYEMSAFNLVYKNQNDCVLQAKIYMQMIIRGKLYNSNYRIASRYYANFMGDGMFRINCMTFKPDSSGYSHSKEYSYDELFIKANSAYGYIFNYDKLQAASSLSEAIQYAPKIVKAEAHITDVVPTGKSVDNIIYRDNASADAFIINTTNPESQYTATKTSAEYLKLSDTKFTKFNAIRAKSCTGNQYVSKVDGKIVVKVNKGWAQPLTSALTDAYGTNIIYAYAYEDQWIQRRFQMEETWNLMFYICDASGNVTEEYTGLYFNADVDGDCNKVYRALFNIYSDEANDRISEFETTNQGIYDLDTGKENTYLSKRVVRYAVVQKFGGMQNAMQDIYDKQLKFTTSISGHKRGALYTSYLTAGTISYDNGSIKVDYKLTPSNIKPLNANGVTLGQAIANNDIAGYSITNNGIYVKAQTKLKGWQVGVYTVEPIVSTFTTSHIVTTTNSYSICVGQYNCNCEDINVLCSCEDEEMGCNPDDVCEDASDPNCKSAYDCSEDPSNPKCECFDGDGEEDCYGRGWIEESTDPAHIITNDPGGQTGGGAIDYFNKYYKPSSSLTN